MSVINQINDEYSTKNEWIAAYLHIILDLKSKFVRCDFKEISIADNNYANSLANLASTVKFQFIREVLAEHIPRPNIEEGVERNLKGKLKQESNRRSRASVPPKDSHRFLRFSFPRQDLLPRSLTLNHELRMLASLFTPFVTWGHT